MSSEKYDGILVYSEFDGKVGPVVRAHYPEILHPEELKRLAAMYILVWDNGMISWKRVQDS